MTEREHVYFKVLIVTLFACGAALLALRAAGDYYREQLWIATQAALPIHHARPVTQQFSGQQIWKTYRNLEYGFEFKYPEKLYAFDNLNDFKSNLNDRVVVSLYNIDGFNTVQKCHCGEIERFVVRVATKKYDSLDTIILEQRIILGDQYTQKVTVGGLPAIRIGEMTRVVYLVTQGRLFKISPVDKILSTIKFTK